MSSNAVASQDISLPESKVVDSNDRDARERKISDRLACLGTVEDGWFEGRGVALDKAGLRWLERQMTDHYIGTEMPLPFLFPTVPGGAMLEWSLERFECAIEIDLEARTGSWVDVNLETDEGIDEEILELDSVDGWRWLTDRLRGFVGLSG